MTDIVLDTAKLDQIMAGLNFNTDQVIKWLAFQVEAGAKMRAPVDTGALRNSLQTEKVEDGVWRVRDGVEYGIWQETGTSKMPPHPFLIPACEQVAGDMNSGRTWERLFK